MAKKRKPETKLRPDANEIAFRIAQAAVGNLPKPVPPEERTDEDKDAIAVERGRKGGQKGGKARIESLTDRQRRALAKKAARKRWENSETG